MSYGDVEASDLMSYGDVEASDLMSYGDVEASDLMSYGDLDASDLMSYGDLEASDLMSYGDLEASDLMSYGDPELKEAAMDSDLTEKQQQKKRMAMEMELLLGPEASAALEFSPTGKEQIPGSAEVLCSAPHSASMASCPKPSVDHLLRSCACAQTGAGCCSRAARLLRPEASPYPQELPEKSWVRNRASPSPSSPSASASSDSDSDSDSSSSSSAAAAAAAW
jgi:hypothetical protein